MEAAFSASVSMSSSWRFSWTKSLEPAMHVCPVAAKMPETTPLAAASTSTSSNTMLGDLPPSSSETLAMWSAASFITSLPVSVEPVKATLSIPGWRTRADPVAGDDVEDARRKPGLLEEPGELQRRGGSLFRRFRHEGAACGQSQLPGQEEQRRVPRHDGTDHADRLPPRVNEEVGVVGGDGAALDLVGSPAK